MQYVVVFTFHILTFVNVVNYKNKLYTNFHRSYSNYFK